MTPNSPARTVQEIRKKWSDLRNRTKAKEAARRKEGRQTGRCRLIYPYIDLPLQFVWEYFFTLLFLRYVDYLTLTFLLPVIFRQWQATKGTHTIRATGVEYHWGHRRRRDSSLHR